MADDKKELSLDALEDVAGGFVTNIEWVTCSKCGEKYPKDKGENCPYCMGIIVTGVGDIGTYGSKKINF